MTETIKAALSATNHEEKISHLNNIFTEVKENNPDTKVYKRVLQKMKQEKISLRTIPVLAENKNLRGMIAKKIRNLN